MLLAKWLPILTEDGESGACAAVLLVQVTHQRLLKKLAGEGRALFKSHNRLTVRYLILKVDFFHKRNILISIFLSLEDMCKATRWI